jgi:hypothetical protein
MRLIALLTLSLLSGCATTAGYEAMLSTWVGDSEDNLVSKWGPPQSSYPLSNGGRVLQYGRSGNIVIPGMTTYQPVTTYNSGTVSGYGTDGGYVNGTYNGTATTYVPQTSEPIVIAQRCTTRFTVNSDGRITNWSWEGNACRAVAPK